jgi:hypothetical protein
MPRSSPRNNKNPHRQHLRSPRPGSGDPLRTAGARISMEEEILKRLRQPGREQIECGRRA